MARSFSEYEKSKDYEPTKEPDEFGDGVPLSVITYAKASDYPDKIKNIAQRLRNLKKIELEQLDFYMRSKYGISLNIFADG